MAVVQEIFNAYPVAANGTRGIAQNQVVGGFLCTTAGNCKVGKLADGSGADIIANFAVVVGTFYPMPFAPGEPAAVVLSGGAAGTVFAL